MTASPCAAKLQSFEVIDAELQTRAGTSAPVFAPLSFAVVFTVLYPISASALCARLDFVADVASAQPPVSLVPLQCVAPVPTARSLPKDVDAANTVTMSSSSSPFSTAAFDAQATSTAAPLLVPDVAYRLAFTVKDFAGLRAIPLKHLLQVSMMQLSLVVGDATTLNTDANKVDVKQNEVLATWNVVWHVRRDPQNDQELVRTVLDPLA